MERKFVQIEDIARKLQVSVSTIRTWVRQGHIPEDTYIQVGKTYRFSEQDVLESLLRRQPTRHVVEEEAPSMDVLDAIDEDY
jgi:excisionase family DNA binding protein